MATQGRPYRPTDADRELVYRLAMAGRPQKKIAQVLNLHEDTMRKHFRFELTTAKDELIGKSVKCLSDAIDDGSVDAAKFVLSRQAGWSEQQKVDHSSADGSMTPPTRIIIEAATDEGSKD